jgi:dual specificity tyrosine-phosphorylation-regulated kinase 2/3/4
MPMAAPRMVPRNESPIKRHNTITTPSASNRPLPEPPATSFKNGTAVRNRDISGGSGVSPSKPPLSNVNVGAGTRRISGVGVNGVGVGNKRTSTGAVLGQSLQGGASGLPRVTTRSVSARQEMANAGASAAMKGQRA